MVRIWIENLTFSDDSNIKIDKDEIVALVGPNNAGKSATLKEAATLIKSKKIKGKVLKDINISKEGDATELLSFLEKNSKKRITTNPLPHYRGYKYDIYQGQASNGWANYKDGIAELDNIFVNALSTENRLTAANPPQSIKITSESPNHPIHYLQKDDGIEKRFSDYFKQAFGTDLIVHRNAGNEVPLYVGERPIPKNGEDRISQGYLIELEKLDLLHQQGDGMRGFVGVLLNAFISNYSLLFIDEPEAFLHPPQARLLGKMLSKDLPSGKQLFLATHSIDFLKGLLDSNHSKLKIIRIRREGKLNKVSVLNSVDIESIWSDSLLRHSNVLDGLFHSKVIICESDSDSRFFSAIISALYTEDGEISPDILFIHCGGKHRIPTVIKSLRKLDVPISVVTDFDVLNNINPIKPIYEDLGGDWSSVENDWKIVKTEIEQKRPEFLTADLKNEVNSILDSTTERIFPKANIIKIQTSLKKASAWSEAKGIGKAYIPPGNASQAFERIQIKFKEVGFFILEVGELESFDKTVGNHGPKWVNEILRKNLKLDPNLELARNFVRQIVEN